MKFPFSFRLHALSRTLSLAAALFFIAGVAQAQYLWLQREGLTVEAPTVEAPPASVDLRVVASRVDSTSGTPAFIHCQARFGRAETKAVNDLEPVPTEPNGNTFKLVWKGNTVPASQVDADTSEDVRHTATLSFEVPR